VHDSEYFNQESRIGSRLCLEWESAMYLITNACSEIYFIWRLV